VSYRGWAPYVSVAKRRAKAAQKMKQLRKQGRDIQPVEIQGRSIAKSFWGKAWCDHQEAFSDYDNRLPRGRTYARNGSVCHLHIGPGRIEALVSGSSLYEVEATIKPLSKTRWQALKGACAGEVASVLDLLQGRLSAGVMARVTDPTKGLFPQPGEMRLQCNCPDWADMCKHIAAVLYGVGARLDEAPELLFELRSVDHSELVGAAINLPKAPAGKRKVKGDLSNIFGIDLDDAAPEVSAQAKPASAKQVKTKPVKPKPVKAKSANTKPVKAKPAPTAPAPVARKKRRFRITGKGVIRLRKYFGMNMSQFSRLAGVSPATVKNWEAKPDTLNLRPDNLAALEQLKPLDRAAAWALLEG